MPIPTTRSQLTSAMDTAYDKLGLDLDRVTAATAKACCVDDWTVIDLITVRTWWANSVVGWIEAGQRGETPPTPAPGYTWKQTPQLNREVIVAAPRRRSWKRVRAELGAGHDAVHRTLQSLRDEELERAGVFDWAGRWPVLRWVSIATTTGYVSARKYVRALLRRLDAA